MAKAEEVVGKRPTHPNSNDEFGWKTMRFCMRHPVCFVCLVLVALTVGCETTNYDPLIVKKRLRELEAEIETLKSEVADLKKDRAARPPGLPVFENVTSQAPAVMNVATPSRKTLSASEEKQVRDELEALDVYFSVDDSGFAVEADLMECREGNESVAKLADFAKLTKVIFNGPSANSETYRLLAKIPGIRHLELERSHPDAASLEQLKSLKDLKYIQLFKATLSEDAMKTLSEFPSLEQIRCGQTRVGDAELKHLANLKSLRAIDLSDCNRVSTAGLRSLANCPKLQFLKVWGPSIDNSSMEVVATMKALKVLGMNDSRVTDEGIQKLAGLDLVEVHLFRTSVGDGGVEVLSQMPNLAVLNLRDTKVTDLGVSYLPRLKKLKKLDLSECPAPRITDEAGKSLARIPGLTQLNLWSTSFSDEGVKHLSWLSNLTWLNLDNTQITDDTIAMLNEMPQLTWLHLGKTNITDREVKVLAGLENLRYLNISQTKISEDAFYDLDDIIAPKGGTVIGP